MAEGFLKVMVTPAVARAQENYFGDAMDVRGEGPPDALSDDAAQFIAARDSFYFSSVSENGWPLFIKN